MPEGHFDPLPLGQPETPTKRGKFLDVEVYGNINASSGTFDSITITNAQITNATITGTTTITSATITGGSIGALDVTGILTMSGAGAIKSNSDGNKRVHMISTGLSFYDASDVLQGSIAIDTNNDLAISSSILETPTFTGSATTAHGSGIDFPASTSESVTADMAVYSTYSGATGNIGVWQAPNTASYSGYMSAGFITDLFRVTTGADPSTGTILLELDRGGGPGVIQLPWQAWTPSYTNQTIGNGTVVARYVQIGDTIHAEFSFILGSTSSVGSNPLISMPTAFATGHWPVGTAYFLDSGTASYQGAVEVNGIDDFFPRVATASGSYTQNAGLTASVPFTWTTSDRIAFSMTYEAA